MKKDFKPTKSKKHGLKLLELNKKLDILKVSRKEIINQTRHTKPEIINYSTKT